MNYILIIIGCNVLITLWFLRSTKNQEPINRFLFIPAEVARGENFMGLLLSHFSHTGFGHLIFNMISFFFFADNIIYFSGPANLFLIYILSGIGSDALVLMMRKNDPGYRCLGASGSVSGIIFAAIIFDPSTSIYLYFIPVPIPGPIFAVLYILVSTFLMRGDGGGISHEAHIGGAITGLVTAGMIGDGGFQPILEWFGAFLG